MIDDADRPRLVPGPPLLPEQQRFGERLVQLHDIYRDELDRLRVLVEAAVELGEVRAAVQRLSSRAALDGLGNACELMCRSVEAHHRLEDQIMLPDLVAAQVDLAPVVERIGSEHLVIDDHLRALDDAVLDLVDGVGPAEAVEARFETLDSMLRSHFAYEEEQLVAPIGRHHVLV